MSRYQSIENELESINGDVFQELCDKFLLSRNPNYSAFSRTGSQAGKQKTRKGTPDSFFLLQNGNYLFVESTTNTSDKKKLANDIKACFDNKKSKIPKSKIEEIVLCFNWTLDQSGIEELINLARGYKKDIRVTFFSLDALAMELHRDHRDLVYEYLNLPLDSGQIVSVETFITEYNKASQGLATPLDNTFFHREKELEKFQDLISHNDLIILNGAPGVGKTKLAIEGIKNFLSQNMAYRTYCVSYKHHTLLDDLHQYLDPENDYILFVDDANRIDEFNQIIGFYKSIRTGKLKIIITVRDYAYQSLMRQIMEYSFQTLEIFKFSDNQIIDILESESFKILNQEYQKVIIQIADGNIRIAIMTALLAKAKQNIEVLYDVSDLFEKYFSTFINDNGEFAKQRNINCLGLIAFFYSIPFRDKEFTKSILNKFEIEYPVFIDSIDVLEKLELVEIKFGHVKVPEQNLSTYFFYKAFIKDASLSFRTLLQNYFTEKADRFRDCVIPASNILGYQNVMDKLKPELKKYWEEKNSSTKVAFEFLSIFWYYLQTETLAFIFNKINMMEKVSNTNYKVTKDNHVFDFEEEKVIDLLGEFFITANNLKDAIELALEYTRRNPHHLPTLIHKIKEELVFDRDDEFLGFLRQTILYDFLIQGLNKNDELISVTFFELSKTFLSFKFSHTKGGRKNSITTYIYSIPNIEPIRNFRKGIWEAVDANYRKFPKESIELMKSYASVSPDVLKEIMEFDIPFVLKIIDNYLSVDSFDHCRYVQDQIRWCQRNNVSHSSFSKISQKFTNRVYKIFLKIDWNRLRDKEMFDFNNHQEYKRLKVEEIRASFVFKDLTEINTFYSAFKYLRDFNQNHYNRIATIDIIIDENCNKNFNIGCQILQKIIDCGNEIEYIPRMVFQNHLNSKEKTDKILSIIQNKNYKYFYSWELSFFENLADSLVSIEYAQKIINLVSKVSQSDTICFDRLQKYLKVDPGLFENILLKVFEINANKEYKINIWGELFNTHFDNLGDNLELIKKAYLQQSALINDFDYLGKGFLNILNKDATFLIEYIEQVFSDEQFQMSPNQLNLEFVWEVDNIERVLVKAFNKILLEYNSLSVSKHFCNSFFNNLLNNQKSRAEQFVLEYAKANNSDIKIMNMVVNIARNSLRDIFERLLIQQISINQNLEIFKQIWWIGRGGAFWGEVIIGEIEAKEWRGILHIIEKCNIGTKRLPFINYVNERIESCLRSGDWERERRFIEHF